jgi:hypothetical protein
MKNETPKREDRLRKHTWRNHEKNRSESNVIYLSANGPGGVGDVGKLYLHRLRHWQGQSILRPCLDRTSAVRSAEHQVRHEEITMMHTLNGNATTQAKTMTSAQRAGIILTLACFVMLVSSVGAQVTLLYNFGTHAGDPAHPNYPGFVVQGRDGNLYSTSNDGGTDNAHFLPADSRSAPTETSTALRLKTAPRTTGLSSKSPLKGNSHFYTGSTIAMARPHGGLRSKARMALSTEPQKMGDRQTAALYTALLLGERSRRFITSTEPTAASPLRH